MFDRKGGRVTELVAKPLLEILFPEIHKFSQPLSGMIAGRKNIFEQIVFEKDNSMEYGDHMEQLINKVIEEDNKFRKE